MKLKKLRISNAKGFENFCIDFDLNSPITTIIGQNGVGKSNLIEIVISIFRAIDLGESTNFSYSLIYECRKHELKVLFDALDASKNLVVIDGVKKSFAFLKNNANEYLPLNIFTYYSGTNLRIESLFLKHQTRFYEALTKGDDRLLRRFFYCREEHGFFVLLAFLVDDELACKNLLAKLNIDTVDSVLFCLKKPYWYKGKPNDIMLAEGDPRFWHARGVVKDFLGKLWECAIAPIDNTERKTIDFRGRTESQERLYLYLADQASLKKLASNYQDTTTLFKNIESTYIADLLEDVQVTLNTNDGKKLTFAALSEGERQLLTVLGLMKFTRNDESLFLLDEPDTHLNPRWKLDYFDQIKRILDHKIEGSSRTAWESSQILLTTHDPLMLTSLKADQIRVISLQEDGTKTATLPDEDPINLGVEAIIQSELYGIRTSLDKDLQHKIDLRNRLSSQDEISGKPLEKLQSLNAELDSIGVQYAHPNPYFSNFAKAISRNPLFRRPEFTAEEYDAMQALSDRILSDLINEKGEDD